MGKANKYYQEQMTYNRPFVKTMNHKPLEDVKELIDSKKVGNYIDADWILTELEKLKI